MAIEMTPTQIQKADFPASRKGYDQDAVRAHLRDAAAALESALRRAKIAEDQARRAEEAAAQSQQAAAAVPQEQQVADETARVLMAAREAAASVEEQARETAEQILNQAQQQAAQVTSEAETRAAQIVSEAETRAAQIVDGAEAAQAVQSAQSALLEDANKEAEAIVAAANANATKILDDAKEKADAMLAKAEIEVEAKKAQLEEKRQAAIQELELKRQKALEEIEQRKAELIELKAAAGATKQGTRKARPSGPVKVRKSGEVGSGDLPDEAPPRRLKARPSAASPPRDSGEVRPAIKARPSAAMRDSGEVPKADEGKDFESLFGRFKDGANEEIRASDSLEPVDEVTTVSETAETVEMRSPVATTSSSMSPNISMEASPSGLSMELPATDAVALQIPDEANSKVLDVLKKQLLRKLKRGLQDEQNQLIEALRQKGSAASSEIVPQPMESLKRVRKTIDPVLQEISKLGWSTGGGTGSAPVVHATEDTLTTYLISPLNGQLGQAITEGQQAGEDVAVLSDRVNNVYRSWKGPELAELAARLANEAFMSGRGAVAS